MLSSTYSNFNNLPNANQLRQPRAIVMINGFNVLWTDIEIETTTYYIADNYRIEIPLSGQPNGFNLEYLAFTAPITVQIWIGFPPNPNAYTTADLSQFPLMVGDVDKLEIDPLTMIAKFSGRDLSSRLSDTKTYAKYSNSYSSDIAISLAKEHGLTPRVTPSRVKAGTFYKFEHTLLTKETTEWDLLTFLAQSQDWVVFVDGAELVFEPRPTVTTTPYILQYTPPTEISASPIFTGMDLFFTRSLTLANDVKVLLRVPTSPQSGKAFTVTATSQNHLRKSTGLQVFTYTIPGLSKEQAQQRANRLATEITLHEIRLNANVPGDNLLKKDSIIQVRGVTTSFNQNFYPDMVTRKINISEGYNMTIAAKNHSTASEVIE